MDLFHDIPGMQMCPLRDENVSAPRLLRTRLD
jgi:hypothetical protein